MGQNQPGVTEFVEVVGDTAVLTTENPEGTAAKDGTAPTAGVEKKELTARARGDRMHSNASSTQAMRCAKHNLPFATVDFEKRILIIVARHHNEWCENHIPLLDLGLISAESNKPSKTKSKRAPGGSAGENHPNNEA